MPFAKIFQGEIHCEKNTYIISAKKINTLTTTKSKDSIPSVMLNLHALFYSLTFLLVKGTMTLNPKGAEHF